MFFSLTKNVMFLLLKRVLGLFFHAKQRHKNIVDKHTHTMPKHTHTTEARVPENAIQTFSVVLHHTLVRSSKYEKPERQAYASAPYLHSHHSKKDDWVSVSY